MRLLKTALLTFTLLILISCQNESIVSTSPMQEIYGRDRHKIYRIQAPQNWIKRDPLPNDSLEDTTKSLCEFIIKDTDGIIRITIHNFPSETIDERIPPQAQIARWKTQFQNLSTHHITIPQSFSGYTGYLFEGEGMMNNNASMILGWVLQVANPHYQTLLHSSLKDQKQMRADVTLKAVGPVDMMKKHKNTIIKAARTFELIDEIPHRS